MLRRNTYALQVREGRAASPRANTHCSTRASANASASGTASASASAAPTSRRAALAAAAALAFAAVRAPVGPAAAALVDEEVATSVYDAASPSVVSVIDFRAEGAGEEVTGVGSGVVWDALPQGEGVALAHIVTNYHVISQFVLDTSKRQRVRVVFGGGGDGEAQSFPARIVGTDSQHDLAVLAVDVPAPLPRPVRLAASAGLRVGMSVFAIGNPGGLTRTLSSGVLSGVDRTIASPAGTRIYGALQTDATVNAGNSGGALLDGGARLVGLATASFTRPGSGRGSGVNFALPADMLRTIVPNLIVYGTAAGRGV